MTGILLLIMDQHHRRVEELFHHAITLSKPEREAWLDRACGGDARLRADVESLLGIDEEQIELKPLDPLFPRVGVEASKADGRSGTEAGRFPEGEDHAARSVAPAGAAVHPLPTRIGRYRIERVLASGGMGTVYLATQDSPRRQVALKTIQAGILSANTIRRFEREAQILASLRHPGIAQIYESGVHEEEGRTTPFFAMEYVPEAEPITEHVQRLGLDLTEKLSLFAAICDAVHHGHQQGIIHRDLKPHNILADGSAAAGVPKVIDFGVARAVALDSSFATMATTEGQLIGTLQYMSPEQVDLDQEGIDERADVYALGLILYEMLTGKRPYELSGVSVIEAVRIIREAAPSRLSTTEQRFPGDLETIVQKALAKERERRYESAAALAADVRRFLEQRPISARPPSRTYNLRVFARRNRALFIALALVLLVSLAAAVVSTTFAIKAGHRARDAERQGYARTMLLVSDAIDREALGPARQLLSETQERWRGWEWRHFTARTDEDRRVLRQDSLEIWAVGVTRDGARVLAEESDSVMVSLDARTGHEEWRASFPAMQPFQIDAEGRTHVPFLTKNAVEIHTLDPRGIETDRVRIEAASLASPPKEIRFCALSPTLDRLAALVAEHELVVWDLRQGRVLSRNRVYALNNPLEFSPDGSLIAAPLPPSPDSNGVVLYESKNLRPIGRLAHTEWARGAKFSLDGRMLVTYGSDRTIRLWDVARCRSADSSKGRPPTPLRTFEGFEGIVWGAAFSPDGSMVAGCSPAQIRLWDTETGKLLRLSSGQVAQNLALTFGASPAAPAAAGSVGSNGSVRSDLLISGDGSGCIRLWNIWRPNPAILAGHQSFLYAVAFTPDGSRIVSGGWDGYRGFPGCLRIWDAATSAPIAALGDSPWIVMALALAPDGNHALVSLKDASGKAPGRLDWIDLETGARRTLLTTPTQIDRLSLDPAGRRAVISDRSGAIRVVDTDTGEVLFTHAAETGGWSLGIPSAWSPDGRILASSENGEIQIRDARSFAVLRSWKAHAFPIWCLAFDHTGRRIVSCSADPIAKVWSVDTGREVAELIGHGPDVFCAAFSPDDARLATGGRDGKIRLWETESFSDVGILSGHENYVYSIDWSPDGERLVSGSGDGTARIWEVTPERARIDAIRERDGILAKVEPAALLRLAESADPPAAAEAIRTDPSLTPREREVALQVLLRESIARAEPAR